MVPPLCRGNIQFLDLEKFATLFVENTIQEAIEIIIIRNQPKEVPDLLDKNLFQDVASSSDDKSSYDSSVSSVSSTNPFNIYDKQLNEWTNIGLFSKIDMLELIKRFISKWELKYDWMHCINLICEERNKSSDSYYYEVKWSIPTKQYPIPQVTASVYFQIEVPRCKPKCSPINVSYRFEGSGLVHRPNKIRFNEKWLLSILENKIRFISQLRF